MKVQEKRVLCFIKVVPSMVTILFYISIISFLFYNQKELLTLYFNKLSLIFLIITALIFFSSHFISKILETYFINYKKELKKELEKNRKKDSLLFQQSKMATIGELLSNISHQWRQPLSIITTAATAIQLQKELKETNEKQELKNLEGIVTSAKYLSQTIEDFRNFYNPNVPKKEFFISHAIESSLKIIKTQLFKYNITIEKEIEDFPLYGVESEFTQVLLNLLNNAKEEFKKNPTAKNILKLKSYKDKKNYFIIISDNAGGIKKENISKIFDPYFTTKHHSQGTGIGLYMSQKIISEHFKGNISAKNSENLDYKGAVFTIKIPLE
ncbi:hypothetical protein CRV08_06940 [Halarcobacter ebronensis]|uniref:histidine kinase n=1 Tax=Halarcobacter ebronensis TaxID=1462615 RepID=A0A4Q0YDK7_9BACT|nr:HAMP domain-containing sensor histidine kinase [Halarcobacter ebronensis]RXJ68557.1 hypothetical protein CRV08_06940 [Halarcobacter ebronensis]